jgi:hypothetical protein
MSNETFGMAVCKNVLLSKNKETGIIKQVPPSYTGETLCDNAFLVPMKSSKMTPDYTHYCQSCLDKGFTHDDLIKEKAPMSEERKDELKERLAKYRG